MSDIVARLRNWREVHLARLHFLMEEAADEIERLRLAIRRLAEQDATLSVVGGNVIVEMECQDLSQKNCTLTDAEREALRFCFAASLPETEKLGGVAGELCRMHRDRIRGLLERLG